MVLEQFELLGSGYGNYTSVTTITPNGCYNMNMYDSFGDGWNGELTVLQILLQQIYYWWSNRWAYGTDVVCWGPLDVLILTLLTTIINC